MSSELNEKQQLLGFFFSNLKLDAGSLDVELREPFNNIAKLHDQTVWRSLIDAFRAGEVTFDFTLQRIQTAYSVLKLEPAIT